MALDFCLPETTYISPSGAFGAHGSKKADPAKTICMTGPAFRFLILEFNLPDLTTQR
jgi:hypothetical protein